MKLEGTHSLVTGGSSGIGLATAKKLAAAGSSVSSFDIQSPLEHANGVTHYQVNLRYASDIERGMRLVPRKIDLLFNNVGKFVRGGLLEVSPDAMDQMIAVNVRAQMEMMKVARTQEKLAEHPLILQMCSTVGAPPPWRKHAPKVGAYAYTKLCVHEWIQQLRITHPEYRVKGIYPGAVKTPMTLAGFASEAEYEAQARANWGVFHTADEIAEKIMELIESGAADLFWDPGKKEYVFE